MSTDGVAIRHKADGDVDAQIDDEYVVWGDPPPTGKYGLLIEGFVERLKARPGEWGSLPPFEGGWYPMSVATALNKGYGGDIEVTTRATETKNKNRIYARWVGPEEPDDEVNKVRQQRIAARRAERIGTTKP
jgi:hypothetical protein